MKKKKHKRLPNGSNRDELGRFIKGCTPGPGNPFARQVSKLRSALLSAVTEKDIKEIVGKLVERAKTGDLAAVKELMDRCIGKPLETDIFERIEKLEALLNELAKSSQ